MGTGKTVVVVGAGASTEFGPFPVGSELAEQIEARLADDLARQDGPVISALSSFGGFSHVHRSAMARIINGLQSRDSIDQFVDDCRDEPQVPEVAKLAIAHCVMEAERASELARLRQDGSSIRLRAFRNSWLGQICRIANPGTSPQTFPLSLARTCFVAFNYDRCIEAYLLSYASETLSKPVEEVGKLVREIPILHPFGQLGALEHLAEAGKANATVRFGERDPRYLWHAAQGIRTFTQELDSEHGERVHELLDWADTVVFLGFQYHEPNMRILF